MVRGSSTLSVVYPAERFMACAIGVPSTLNCANYVYFLALESCLELQNTEAVAFMTAELLNLHRGQGRGLVPAH